MLELRGAVEIQGRADDATEEADHVALEKELSAAPIRHHRNPGHKIRTRLKVLNAACVACKILRNVFDEQFWHFLPIVISVEYVHGHSNAFHCKPVKCSLFS